MRAWCAGFLCVIVSPAVAFSQLTGNSDEAERGRPYVEVSPAVLAVTERIDFNDLAELQPVAGDRYLSRGVQIGTGPNSTEAGALVGSNLLGPCDGTRSLATEPFSGPSILLRFPGGTTEVSLQAGDFGPSDEDTIIVTAFGDDSLKKVVDSDSAFQPSTASGCHDLMVKGFIKAVEIISADGSPNSVYIDNLEFTLLKNHIRLEKLGKSVIEASNKYSENTMLRASVVFPPGHPKAGSLVRDFEDEITFSEETGTSYYNGTGGSTALPQMVAARRGVAEIEIKSVSNSNNVTGPIAARIRAEATDLDPEPVTNPLSVDQWNDEDRDGFIDWLAAATANIDRCLRRQRGEVKAVQTRVNGIGQESTSGRCGSTPILLTSRSPIFISPVCGTPNRHRLNVSNELSDTVLHEARHAWQNSQRAGRLGTDDDGVRSTPRNDDDFDFFLEVVSFASALLITEGVSGTGDTTPDPGGVSQWETDAPAYGGSHKSICP